jgi:16S rRNA (guanine966-N2)-methyltransferase
MTTRPTPDRVKESLFSILGGRVHDAKVLDLFAGTGALGLEALSRGAAFATFVEQDAVALTALRKNVELVGITTTEVLPVPYRRALTKLAELGRQYDLVFLDPPYAADLLPSSLRELDAGGVLLSQALVVCEHHGREAAPQAPFGYETLDVRVFGDVALSLLEYVKGRAP